ncbi:hypothetical protein EYC84_008603 [Monilinia fructicola]|uniref:Uncharacterized protein n=1 Tax=Monilinia fructicola TaxID=38448 RepID=A0A5M9JJT4_MONFR|nr:hypothetical protein EYC84_008603 [Monilinia fructicola]
MLHSPSSTSRWNSIKVQIEAKDKQRVFILGLILFTITKKKKTSVSRIIDTIHHKNATKSSVIINDVEPDKTRSSKFHPSLINLNPYLPPSSFKFPSENAKKS